ncbi:hypothetical protein CDA63_17845 [Hymenobacter amundsenii]|uniref:Glycosyltransferase RgtA/B/C/D-like domain-containing protein n=1 Tax=Hymenobacter amundsenii TaxID=2006685 RepID=A0A246FJE8_9BACT|nr:hypothetical protein [Hymenobacter amundsenii]OWP61725.1 hypothetical protein CDA63_17845 [Hymenobacter amundsenii]
MRNTEETTLPPPEITSRASPIICYGLLLASIVLLVASFYQRVLHGDEAWIGEQAYWAAKEGAVRSELFRGFLGAESRQWVYHWLFVWQAAAVIKVAGWSVTGLKLISLSYLGIFLLISYRHLRRHYLHSAAACCLFYAVLLSNALLVEYSFVFRPEVMLMCLGFGSWIMLERSLHRPTPRLGYAALGALLAGLAALTHLNGLIYVAAGLGLLLLRRQYRAAVLFGGVSGLVFSVAFLDVLVHNAWPAYFAQLAPAVNPEPHRVLAYLLHVLNEHKRFLHSPVEAVLSVLGLAAGLLLYRTHSGTPRRADAALYLGLLIGALACLSPGKTTKYLLLYLPHIGLFITLAFVYLSKHRPWQRWLLGSLLLLYLLTNAGYTGYLISRHEDRVAKNQQLARQLASYQHCRVVAPLELVFNQINNFTIQGVPCYLVRMEAGQLPPDGRVLFTEAARFHRQLIILNDNSLHDLGLPRPVVGRTYGKYRYAYRFQDYYIYKAL